MKEFDAFIDLKPDYIKEDTAVLAKAKGFNKGSKTVYIIHKNGKVEWYDDYFTINNKKGCDASNKSWTVYEAPTQAMLKKWLKLKHNIILLPEFSPTFGWYFTIRGHFLKRQYWTLEELAMEEGLKHALNLLPDDTKI